MRKFLTLILASAMLASTAPVMAAEAQVSPEELQALGLTPEEIANVDEATVDELSSSDMNTQQRWGYRYCPRGYYLQAYRIRIGRFVIVRYRCVRYHYGGWYMVPPSGMQQPDTVQTVQ